jgi:4-hydroxybenzoate polyprenyltransferase
MVGARTAAMGFNRIADRHIDARNPRTAGRELPDRQGLAGQRALS